MYKLLTRGGECITWQTRRRASKTGSANSRIRDREITCPERISLTDVWISVQPTGKTLATRMNGLRPVREMNPKSLLAAAAALLVATAAYAQDTQAPTANAQDTSISLELNKLESTDKGCKAYVVTSNPTTTSYDALRLDLVMFQTDGVIGRRFALELAPLQASRRTVKSFELDGTKCDGIGSFLINDVLECKSATGPVSDCLSRIKVKSLTKVELSK